LGVVVKVARQQAGRSRTLQAAKQAALTTARAFGRVLHELWLEVTGLIFLIMGLSFAGAAVKEYGKYHAGQAGPKRLVLAICFTLTFAWFGVSSFWRVRRKNKRAR
jgi:hypothetical protein